MKNFKIAVIDSGIGGLSLLKTLVCNLNVKNYIYFADLKNLPYGTKTQEQLLCLTIKNINYIIKNYSPDIIDFGCNTIGSTIYKDVKKIFPNQKFFAIKPCIKNIKSKTLVIATSGTINALLNNKSYIKNKKNIVLCKMPKLATKVENYIQNGTHLVTYLKRKLLKYKSDKTIILGCTHYYFVKDIISKLLPKTRVVDGRLVVLKKIKKYLNLNKKYANLVSNNKDIKYAKIKWCLTAHKNNLAIYKNIANNFLKK